MPYSIKKKDGDHIVINSETGKMVPGGNHGDDKDKAKRHIAALYANVKEAKSMAEYDTALAIRSGSIFSIGELEAALDVAITNEPINRREGNIEQADLELRHATDFRDAINLLSAGKSLPSELTNNISSSIKSYLKGGPGSGRHPDSGSIVKESPVREGIRQRLNTYNEDIDRALAMREAGVKVEHITNLLHTVKDAIEEDIKNGIMKTSEAKKLYLRLSTHESDVTHQGKKSFSDLKSEIEDRVSELSVNGGAGSGNFA